MRFLVFLLVALVFAAPARAGSGCAGYGDDKVQALFDGADLNSDGALDAAEYGDANLERFGVSFEQSDLDGDGITTWDEYFELYEVHHPVYEEDPA